MLYLKIVLCIFLIAIQYIHGFYQSASNVTVLTSQNFDEFVYSDRIWVVQFYSHNSREDSEQEFLISANILKNIVKFGAVNIDIENDTGLVKRFSVDTKPLPLIKIFGILNSDQAITYNGSKTSKDLVDWILMNILEKIKNQFGEILPENLVLEVNDKNFDQIIINSPEPWLVQFYAPWCVHCKEFKPVWEQAAVYLKGKIKLASIDATANKYKAREYDIKAYPTVKLFPVGQKIPKTTLNYANDRSVTEIVNWVLDMLPGPEVIQITDPEAFVKNCMSKKLCVVSLLPHISECKAACRGNYLAMLKQLGETYKRHYWGWTWSEGGAQKDIENIFHVGGFGYPTLIVLNPGKKKYSVFKGAFTKNNINEFLVQLSKANAASVDDDIVSKIVELEEWDGDDLSEDIDDNEIKNEL